MADKIETEATLCAELQKWCTDQNLPQISAEELIHEDLTTDQRQYLAAFIIRWEATVYGSDK